MDRGAWWATVHGVTKSRTPLTNYRFHIKAVGEEQVSRGAGQRRQGQDLFLFFQLWLKDNWKILYEMRIPDPLTYLLRNLYAGQEATFRTGHGTTDWFQIGKQVHQGCILLSCLFNFYSEYIQRRQWQPTPVLLPGKSHGWRSLVGCSPWGR